ncbi:DNA mismatch repair protein MLH1 [Nematocida sp. AWRm77]|nr:DNA mismatch repair protein MLH1 [Nematocida sp. AWRm77]
MRIQLLPKEVVERIAAGEVGVSPTAVVKEVLENSLDAGASLVRVCLGEGLLERIEVADNGCGVGEEDLPLLCQRHATSKLREYADLSRMRTLGFRGEGLSSISALGEVTVYTSTAEGEGFVCAYKDSVLVEKKHGVMKRGTRVVIENLFFKDQVKREAYRENRQEAKKVCALVMKYAVCYDCVRFEVEREGKVYRYNTGRERNKMQSIAQIFSQKLQNALIEVEAGTPEGCCTAYVTHANAALSTGVFIVFVNGRLVEMPRLKKAVLAIYREVLVKGHPFIYIEISVPPEHVDVNVHPSKTEVFLNEEARIVSALEEKIHASLQTKRMIGSSRIGKVFSEESVQHKNNNKNNKNNNNRDVDSGGSGMCVGSSMSSMCVGSDNNENLNSLPIPTPTPTPTPSFTQPYTPTKHALERSVAVTPSKKVRTDCKTVPLNLFLSPKLAMRKKLENLASVPLRMPGESESTGESSLISASQCQVHAPLESTAVPKKIRLEHCVFIGMASANWAYVQHQTELLVFDILSCAQTYFLQDLLAFLASDKKAAVEGIPEHVLSLLSERGDLCRACNLDVVSGHSVHFPDLLLPETHVSVSLQASDFLSVISRVGVCSAPDAPSLLAEVYARYLLCHHPLSIFKELQSVRPSSASLHTISSISALYQLFNR